MGFNANTNILLNDSEDTLSFDKAVGLICSINTDCEGMHFNALTEWII